MPNIEKKERGGVGEEREILREFILMIAEVGKSKSKQDSRLETEVNIAIFGLTSVSQADRLEFRKNFYVTV